MSIWGNGEGAPSWYSILSNHNPEMPHVQIISVYPSHWFSWLVPIQTILLAVHFFHPFRGNPHVHLIMLNSVPPNFTSWTPFMCQDSLQHIGQLLVHAVYTLLFILVRTLYWLIWGNCLQNFIHTLCRSPPSLPKKLPFQAIPQYQYWLAPAVATNSKVPAEPMQHLKRDNPCIIQISLHTSASIMNPFLAACAQVDLSYYQLISYKQYKAT